MRSKLRRHKAPGVTAGRQVQTEGATEFAKRPSRQETHRASKEPVVATRLPRHVVPLQGPVQLSPQQRTQGSAVRTASMKPGPHVKRFSSTVQRKAHPGMQKSSLTPFLNIEVERENCYFAGVQRALVHNSCSVDDFTQGWNAKQWQDAIDEFGDSAKWRFKKEKPGSGAKATSDNAPEGSTRVYEIWEGANGKEFEVHYFLDTNGVPSGHKMVERTK